ncbi:MAG: ankyrin repeat domain-containing protein [Candidatus Cardinium sp.]
MDKNLKQADHVKSSSYASKKIMALSFVAAVQTLSCISGRRQGFIASHETGLLQYTDLSALDQDSPEFKKLQNETVKTVSERFAESNKALAKSHVQAAFFKAIKECNLKEVQCLFQNQQIRPNTAENLLNLLVRALQCKREKIFNFLFDEFLKIFDTSDLECLYAKNEEGQTLLHVVIRHRLKPTIESLVDKLPLQGLCVGDNQGRTPLDLAIASNQIHTVELLVKKKLPAQELVKGVILALKHKDTFSFRYKHEKIVHCLLKALLEQCAVSSLGHLSAKDEKGRTLLHLLIRRGDINGVRLLANELPLEALCAQDNKRRRPIVLAARSKSPKMFQILFDKANR